MSRRFEYIKNDLPKKDAEYFCNLLFDNVNFECFTKNQTKKISISLIQNSLYKTSSKKTTRTISFF